MRWCRERVHYNGAAGWHNVDASTTNEAVLKVYNEDGRPEHFGFEAHCRNVPTGTRVFLVCDDERLVSRFRSAGAAIFEANQVVAVEGELRPISPVTSKSASRPDGKPLPADASVDVRQYWHLPAGHPHYVQAIDQLGDTRALALGRPVRIAMGNFTFVGPSE